MSIITRANEITCAPFKTDNLVIDCGSSHVNCQKKGLGCIGQPGKQEAVYLVKFCSH